MSLTGQRRQSGAISLPEPSGGARRDRTDDLMLAKHALSQLSYGPIRQRRMCLSWSGLKRRRRRPPPWLTRGPTANDADQGAPSARRAASATARRASWRVPLTKMVGLGRLELPTSRLSSARSNQLSYKPGARDRLRRGRTMPEDQVRSRRARVSPKETAHPERKRNEDGKVPQKVPDWDLCVPSVPIARFGKNRPEGTSLERR
jgi:hypothetical protein